VHATRHALAMKQLVVTGSARTLLADATRYEENANWYLAGEAYRELATILQSANAIADDQARAMVRAASCFEISGQARPAARAYFDAASLLENNKIDHQTAGELFNRAALLFRALGEYFGAGDSWRRAGEAFSHLPHGIVSSNDNIPPLPSGASNFTFAGISYVAAGDAFSLAGDNAKWACSSYWEAGQMYAKDSYGGYGAFVAFRKALVAAVKFYGTHDRDEMRKYLPLSDAERAAQIDPVAVMESEAQRSNTRHQQMNTHVYGSSWPTLNTNREMAAAYYEFYLAFLDMGNLREAAVCRREKMERLRKVYWLERRYRAAVLYLLWKVAAGYGESLSRWALTCATVLLTFAGAYAALGLIEPVVSWFDYVYFSIVTFTSLGYGDVHPVGIAGKALASTEILAGLVMFGLLLSFIANRAQRTGPGA
jgi:hypothetical protein